MTMLEYMIDTAVLVEIFRMPPGKAAIWKAERLRLMPHCYLM